MSNDYYTLICSLPHLPPQFEVDRLPISRPRLEQRLKMIDPSDAADLDHLDEFLAWDRQVIEKSDEDVARDYQRFVSSIRHPVSIEIVQHRVNVRTIVGALRRRHRDEGPPIGLGNLVVTIRQNWKLPQFGLQRRYPWIERFNQLMLSGQALEAERILLQVSWRTRSMMADQYSFSFEAVLLYLARWSIIERWTSRNMEVGQQRFDQMIEDTLGEYANFEF